MEQAAIRIIEARRIMAISTVRPDGWPQTTIVGYANDGLKIYFMIFRKSQKFANISADDRVSIAIGEEPADISAAQAVFASGHAAEVLDVAEREHAWRLLVRRHPNLAGRDLPDPALAAMIRMTCLHVSVLDYSKGMGHADALHLDGDEVGELPAKEG